MTRPAPMPAHLLTLSAELADLLRCMTQTTETIKAAPATHAELQETLAELQTELRERYLQVRVALHVECQRWLETGGGL
jgi:hypothetical protein